MCPDFERLRPIPRVGARLESELPALDPAITPTTSKSTELEVAATLLRVSNTLRVRLDDALAQQNVTWAGYEVLDILCADGPMTYRKLSTRLDRHRTSITSVVAGLVSSGRVTRELGGLRRDQFVVKATSSGYRTYERTHGVLSTAARAMYPAGGSEEVLAHLEVLERVLRGR